MHAAVLSLPHSDKAGPAAAKTFRACNSADTSRAAFQCCCSWLASQVGAGSCFSDDDSILDNIIITRAPFVLKELCSATEIFE